MLIVSVSKRHQFNSHNCVTASITEPSPFIVCRAAKTLLCYLMETNPTVYQWLFKHLKENPIPRVGLYVWSAHDCC